ncbi:SDR family oxidoreductase [Corynebacterium yudongzhengii]|uniref:SDR family NAD(P)-dependent oxidoreductase n=1 Tax=Corynebacterium yudongzhengii TaxID=2080740 RepID=A0A2U1T5L5_9CORY|nr:SDR family oxidoreductase [Corynebacterium yudongzhengii]AWB81010.1 SDR family oxidoreductase [Corynebacterium yudongzhengii]PWC01255.1 SDR family NAD(P)-dependent oxidoreductase [Corynebacterium yudongzhengii]
MSAAGSSTESARRVAVITGASSGIGAAAAYALAQAGWDVVLGARRLERLQEVAEATGGRAIALDVTDQASVDNFASQIERADLLVNNAGGAKGLERFLDTDMEHWEWMYNTNVLGTVRMTKALLPKLRASGDGLIINIGSKAGLDPYENGSGYNAAKFGLKALTRVLRIEEIADGHPVRVTEIDPGRVATDFSLVRFDGDQKRADAVYADKLNLSAADIAEAIRWVASLPPHMNIDTMNIMPRDQA